MLSAAVEVDGPQNDHLARRAEGFDEDRDVLPPDLAVQAVVAGGALPGDHRTEGVAPGDRVESGVPERAQRLRSLADQQLGPEAGLLGAGDDRRQRDRLLSVLETVPQRLVERGAPGRHPYQSSGSMNSEMVPPQVSPTAKASSSE